MKELEIQLKLKEGIRFVLLLEGSYVDRNEGEMEAGVWTYKFPLLKKRQILIGLALEGPDFDSCSLRLNFNQQVKTLENFTPSNVNGSFTEVKLIVELDQDGALILTTSTNNDPENKPLIKPIIKPERITRGPKKNQIDLVGTTNADERNGEGNFEIPVFFATDRNMLQQNRKISFGVERGQLQYGQVLVNIPKNRDLGEVPRPTWWKFEFNENKDKHVMILDLEVKDKDHFFKELSNTIANADEKDAFIFLHGYNVSFEEAAWRTAQIAHDVKFGGAPIMYSWPSRASTLGYASDEDNVVYSHPKIMQFLMDVREKTGAKKLHLIAHSMGNRGLTNALKDLAELGYFNDFQFSEIIMAAPDIDADIFVNNIAPKLTRCASGRITLYASDKDHALMASRLIRKKLRRAGDAGPNIVCVDGIDSVDASHVDTDLLGHGYFSQAKSLLDDITTVLETNKSPETRGLKAETRGEKRYWSFKN